MAETAMAFHNSGLAETAFHYPRTYDSDAAELCCSIPRIGAKMRH
jgi:hypothetical protein